MNYEIHADLHTHTISSLHGYSTVFENLTTAKNRNLKYLAVTDHYFRHEDSLLRKNEECRIAYISEYVKDPQIKIVSGAELNLTQEVAPNVLSVMWRPIGLHSWFIDRNNSTLEEIEEAFKEGIKVATSFAHIERELHLVENGRHGDKLTPEIKRFLENIVVFAKENNVPLEVNESSIRNNEGGAIDRMNYWLSLAKENNNIIYLGTDAHYHLQVGDFTLSKELLNRFNFPDERIINCNMFLLENYFGKI